MTSDAARADALEEAGRELMAMKQSAVAERDALREQVQEAREALTPFAALAEVIDKWRHEDASTFPHRLKAADIRRAARFLSSSTPEEKPPTETRSCHYCGLPIAAGEKAIEAATKNGWAHVTCWYDGGPFEREQRDRPATPTEER